LAGPDDLEQIDELVHRFTVACACCKAWSPWAWARATWPSASRCSSALAADATAACRLTWCRRAANLRQPLDLLARRDVRRLTQAAPKAVRAKSVPAPPWP
jgi:RNA polymerase sigma-54 factor